MPVCVVWESHFSAEHADAGLEVTEAIWLDMRAFAGYLEHELIRDVTDAGHLIVVSHWATRSAADNARDQYAGHPSAQRANSLVTEPRRRIVGVRVSPPRNG